MARVPFVCLHNAGRSQMSRALFDQIARGVREARSAGTAPAERIDPGVVDAMRELIRELCRVHRLTSVRCA